MRRRTYLAATVAGLILAALVLSAGGSDAPREGTDEDQVRRAAPPSPDPSADGSGSAQRREGPTRPITLAFAGDVHFEAGLAGLPRRSGSTLGPMSRHLRRADLAMVNLESALVRRGERTPKELEDPANRYWFSTPPSTLGLLARSGVDVVTMANNHGADFGTAGLRQSLRAAEQSRTAVVGVGRGAAQAFRPHRATIGSTTVSVLAADAVFRESSDPVWAAGEGGPGIASARDGQTRRLRTAVERADARGDLVVVYLHWGRAREQCPTLAQGRLARELARSGADVVVGSHAHVLLGAGMLGDTYVSYGLGNFAWYHGMRERTGVLRVRVEGGRVVDDTFIPARIPLYGGRPQPLTGAERAADRSDWERLRSCTGLAPVTGREGAP